MKKSSMPPHPFYSPILEEPEKQDAKSFRVLEKGPAARSHADMDQNKEAAAAAPKKLERKTTEDINKSADAFIKKFRNQLMIQRLESIENYEQMLARGL
ncbi:uncharacterized protein LOC133725128 [Rosa rugosa]|uniref:uncharacterized protein LOC133725128 n=1 Tax=Rosa rugosa TaxID=74645 RepID=UPI002B40C615|nr:uncharacterized protein LOC133725128 [Rosa rugosa]